MPAIQLARLKIQITDLLQYFDRPNDFLRELHLLFGYYADRTRRHGQSGTPKPLIQAYNVPKQVLRRIKSDIAVHVEEDPEAAIRLGDHLWDDNWYESRLLAVNILGRLPVDAADQVIFRLHNWGKSCREDALLNTLLDEGTVQIREKDPDLFQQLVEDWISDDQISSRKLGLRSLPTLVVNPSFENLPLIYRLLAPLVRETSSALETDLLRVVRALGQRSPQETVYFLQQNLIAPHKKGLALITRRSLDIFPEDLQESLRDVLREQARQ